MKYILIPIIIVIIVLILLIVLKYLKLHDVNDVINICINNIEALLNQKNEQIVLAIDLVKNEDIANKHIIRDNADIFEKENVLFDINWDINKYIENKEIDANTKEVIKNLSNIEEEIEGLKDYYNINCINYNEIISKKPLNLIYKLLGFKNKKVFKLRKLESYEILKN